MCFNVFLHELFFAKPLTEETSTVAFAFLLFLKYQKMRTGNIKNKRKKTGYAKLICWNQSYSTYFSI